MAKRVVSVALLPKKKPLKSSNKTKKLKNLLKNVLNYIKSDNYMFAPLLSSNSYNLPSSPASFEGEMSCEPFNQNVEEYLKCDYYMYAPLFTYSSDGPNPPKGINRVGNHQMEPIMEDTATNDGNNIREMENDGDVRRQIVVKHNLLQRETVKHVVHQNFRSSSVPGKVLSQKKAHRVVVE